MPDIEEMIRQFIAQNILFSDKGYPYPDEISFLDNGVIDSMNVLELVFFIEQEFGLSVADDDLVPDNFDSVRKLADYVRRQVPMVS